MPLAEGQRLLPIRPRELERGPVAVPPRGGCQCLRPGVLQQWWMPVHDSLLPHDATDRSEVHRVERVAGPVVERDLLEGAVLEQYQSVTVLGQDGDVLVH